MATTPFHDIKDSTDFIDCSAAFPGRDNDILYNHFNDFQDCSTALPGRVYDYNDYHDFNDCMDFTNCSAALPGTDDDDISTVICNDFNDCSAAFPGSDDDVCSDTFSDFTDGSPSSSNKDILHDNFRAALWGCTIEFTDFCRIVAVNVFFG
eukprot:CAMPEP_0179019840 /NCGR_PEP_ID=MMETSP0796-20121207/5076_1 /TAXON_ID=73915 /ORGANISM="Pyrodinium bahamense, Strain pbaha01" /LENGTH=150 /DNA_ID=CAMNT_0020715641 /DNA_START=166 /DNA_END=616 /DNA_ORIENTATION=-